MGAYLFVHFKEKRTPDGEQVYFSVSKDGFYWETINEGEPIIWAQLGEKGVRDHTIVRCEEQGKFYVIATDLCLANTMKEIYQDNWEQVIKKGSTALSLWESDDLVHWSKQRLIFPDNGHSGCHWAPDVIFDQKAEDYILHWSAPSDLQASQTGMEIKYCRTRDFRQFYQTGTLYISPTGRVIDSAIYEESGKYYLFVKSEQQPKRIQLLVSDQITGPYKMMPQFDACMQQLEDGMYEAPTAVQLEDGRWCLFLDYYGKRGAAQGYIPFVSDSLASGNFIRADAEFSFPYGFKHGTILKITDEEYERVKGMEWNEKGYF